ncbi:sensor histidine kinase [Polycladidibacter hongkongensis]|uniref:sensor histidine kinase n=1 Tax=Polycladidibacter hongkongensis TaxID=1647556 RepID=UPI000829AF92|nr:HAMP domain-containing sensor histidine kinase [Pseudovibrio hongkongensis]
MGAPKQVSHLDVAQLAHDLKTPLSAMRTAAELIAHEPLSQSQQRYLGILEAALNNLLQSTDNLLQQSASEYLAEEEDYQALADVLEHLNDLYGPLAEQQGSALNIAPAPLALADLPVPAAKTSSILAALISNALKYAAKGNITVLTTLDETSFPSSMSTTYKSLSVNVIDQGTGIAEEDQLHLFTPFVRGRARATETEQDSGTGLGLYGARKLASELGGDVYIKQSSQNGSIFTLQLPLSVAEDAEPEPILTEFPPLD